MKLLEVTGALRRLDRKSYLLSGGESAGCVVASRPSADPGNRVLLLEAGGKDDWIWIKDRGKGERDGPAGPALSGPAVLVTPRICA